MRKIPQITLLFWIMKIFATTLGETGGDLIAQTLNVGYAASALIFIRFFAVLVILQLFSRKYHPWLYWSVILATSTSGTVMSDFMDRTLGLGYAVGSFILISILVIIFIVWRLSGIPLSVNKINTKTSEILFWTAILFSNTLGTALGDFISDNSGLGFFGGTLLISGLLALIVLAKYLSKISRVFLFWAAFVLTRPFGATMGDFLWKSHEKGGLGLGSAGTSIVLAAGLIILVIYATIKERNNHRNILYPAWSNIKK
ncbi:hypothetical protein [Dehalobacter sp. TeCB1]|uniref:COG4705 family protein n=1 Tax=Dehalobacter sp. TeCB1 TaxID=1843715 RepID=UPI00083B4499|nr:hypothetical protein [Dehalobacter sp. TeCB1]OCZ49821.1 hypothetical protein A7D23_00275 [Dehalobacter sp. TeCB1]